LLLDKHKSVKPGTYLVTLDVSSLYTNIPHNEGADWVCQYYEDTLEHWDNIPTSLQPIDKQTLHDLIIFILQNCTFDFNGEQFKQLYGTTMGAKFSVKFANIYMHCWLSKFVGCFKGSKPEFIARLVDDCFFLWENSIEELITFINYLNNCHKTIKFEATYSQIQVNFLDTITYISQNTIHTTIYVKPTDKKQYLHFTSSHPKHTTRAIPYSQAIRYRRIIDNDDLLTTELANLSKLFLKRGYPLELLNEKFDYVKHMSRQSVLQYKDKKDKEIAFKKYLRGKSFLPLIVPYHQALEKDLKSCLLPLWSEMINSKSDLRKVFSNEFPQIVFKRGTTLGNILTSSVFHKTTEITEDSTVQVLIDLLGEADKAPAAVNPCSHKLCKCCKHIVQTSTYHDSSYTTEFSIDGAFNCNSTDVIYIISCQYCNKLYVGQTSKMVKERLTNHRSDIKLGKNTAIAIHFNEPHHNINHLKITPIADLSIHPPQDRLHIEYNFMKKLDTFYPSGINFYPIINN
jgi:hypothetical protein